MAASTVKYNGTQDFERQPGGSVTYAGNGTATHTVIWRGPLHKLPAFRNSIPLTSPDFGGLKLAAAPSEYHEGAYARVVAQYGGLSNEVSGNFPNDIDNDTPDVPTSTLSANFQVSSVFITVNRFNYTGEFRLDYRAPVNTVNYTSSSKPSNVSGKSRSGIASEADPKILSVYSDTNGQYIASFYLDEVTAGGVVNLMQTEFAPGGNDPHWKVKTAAIDFRRESNAQYWRCSETWTKLIVQAGNDEDFDEA